MRWYNLFLTVWIFGIKGIAYMLCDSIDTYAVSPLTEDFLFFFETS